MPRPARSSVLIVRVWRERDVRRVRARLTWFGDDGLPRSAPMEGSPRAVAAAVQALIETELGPRQ